MYKFSQYEETIPHSYFTQMWKTKRERKGEDKLDLSVRRRENVYSTNLT